MLQLIQMLKEDIGWLFLIPSVLLILSGSIGFAMFICEECEQAVGFAAYGYVNAKDYDGLAEHLIIMRSIERTAGFFIHKVGWLCPLMWSPYLDYHKAFRSQIRFYEKQVKEKSGTYKRRY